MKKVIFVGGTSYSGSTFFDMILSNDPKGFSCGEVFALFRPFKKQHIKFRKALIFEDKVWKEIYRAGEKYLYETIFSLHPEVEFIVDSSKNPLWIKKQLKYLEDTQIDAQHMIIWKTPIEASVSYDKRMRLNEFKRNWTNYHRLYFSIVKVFKSVKYFDFTNNKKSLENICRYLNINYFDEKYEFWNKKQFTLFGNTSAKINMQSKDDTTYKHMKDYLSKMSNDEERNFDSYHQKIYYKKIPSKYLNSDKSTLYQNNKKMSDIISILLLNDISRKTIISDSEPLELLKPVKFNKLFIKIKALKQLSTNLYFDQIIDRTRIFNDDT